MLDQAVGRTPSKETAAGQLHMLRALTAMRLDKESGKKVFDFATRYDVVNDFPAIGAWGIRAWSESQAWGQGKARELISAFRPLCYRRAAASGFLGHGSAAHTGAVASIATQNPDLRPVAALAAAA